jgi:hypothetical protein
MSVLDEFAVEVIKERLEVGDTDSSVDIAIMRIISQEEKNHREEQNGT